MNRRSKIFKNCWYCIYIQWDYYGILKYYEKCVKGCKSKYEIHFRFQYILKGDKLLFRDFLILSFPVLLNELMWGGSILLDAVGAFAFKFSVPAVYVLLMSDEILKFPFTTIRHKSFKWLKNITR